MPSMQRGGCTIETKLGYIDGSIETKLSLLKETMKEFFEEENMVNTPMDPEMSCFWCYNAWP